MRNRSRRGLTATLALVLTFGGAACASEIAFVGSYTWRMDDARFGGLSGIELSQDGTTFTAISDRAGILTGRILRDGGRITGVDAGPVAELMDLNGRPMPREIADSEGLAIGDDGRIYISFEGRNRVWAYTTPETPVALPRAAAFAGLQNNAGLEALAIDAQGRLYTLPERSGDLTRPFPVWRFDGTSWSEVFSIPRRGTYLPVGADFGPDGKLYILERLFNGFSFRSRVRRFTVDDSSARDEETLLETYPFRHDNLEGLSVWQDDSGAIRLTMVSDDNFNPLQRTELVEYVVPESLASAPRSP
ncbi:esterase-like activity of phytase family protein [Salipiger sp.]|uniref:esterase-like activity of phytase family protein n=1 Tax=Salipiger sp. TaxID=2078585 RepID=UPI003A96DA70